MPIGRWAGLPVKPDVDEDEDEDEDDEVDDLPPPDVEDDVGVGSISPPQAVSDAPPSTIAENSDAPFMLRE